VNEMNSILELTDGFDNPDVRLRTFAVVDRSYSYRDLQKTMHRIAGVFDRMNLRQGDRIIVSTENKFAISSLLLAGLRCGITVVFMDPKLGVKRAGKRIEICKPKAYFLDEPIVDRWEVASEGQSLISWNDRVKRKGLLLRKLLGSKSERVSKEVQSFMATIDSFTEVDFPQAVDPETIAYILFTSGTTSTPKAVQISHRSLFANLKTLSKVYGLNDQSRILNILTPHHTDGLIQGPVLSAFNFATWYSPLQFSVDQIPRVFDSIYKFQISHFIAVPTILSLMNKFSDGFEDAFLGEDFKLISTSASLLEKTLWRDFENKFGVNLVNLYGLTETVVAASYCGPGKENRRIGTIGKPIDCEFKIINDTEEEVGDNLRGELLIKGDNLLSGYLNDEVATNRAIKDGWFHTGDIVTRDNAGFFEIVGRKKNIIISGGINIQPEEVSEIINGHPDVSESVCYGIDDEILGEVLIAAVVASEIGGLSEYQLIEYCRSQLEPSLVPKKIVFAKDLPKTISGKIRIEDLRNSHVVVEDSMPPREIEFMQAIMKAASDAFQVEKSQLKRDSSVETLDGWDSMAHLIFVTNLENHLNIRFTSKEIMTMSSFDEVGKVVAKRMG